MKRKLITDGQIKDVLRIIKEHNQGGQTESFTSKTEVLGALEEIKIKLGLIFHLEKSCHNQVFNDHETEPLLLDMISVCIVALASKKAKII